MKFVVLLMSDGEDKSWDEQTPEEQAVAMQRHDDFDTACKERDGVTILAGTDAGNPGTTHGASMHGELELLVRAGLSPAEALNAATAATARAFGLDDRGRIAPGLRADLVEPSEQGRRVDGHRHQRPGEDHPRDPCDDPGHHGRCQPERGVGGPGHRRRRVSGPLPQRCGCAQRPVSDGDQVDRRRPAAVADLPPLRRCEPIAVAGAEIVGVGVALGRQLVEPHLGERVLVRQRQRRRLTAPRPRTVPSHGPQGRRSARAKGGSPGNRENRP